MRIIDVIKNFPTLPYYYDSDDGLWYFVYLGGDNVPAEDRQAYSYVHKCAFCDLKGMYRNGVSSQYDRDSIEKLMKALSGGSRQSGIFTLDEQAKFLQGLSQNELRQIAEQVTMYDFCLRIVKSEQGD